MSSAGFNAYADGLNASRQANSAPSAKACRPPARALPMTPVSCHSAPDCADAQSLHADRLEGPHSRLKQKTKQRLQGSRLLHDDPLLIESAVLLVCAVRE